MAQKTDAFQTTSRAYLTSLLGGSHSCQRLATTVLTFISSMPEYIFSQRDCRLVHHAVDLHSHKTPVHTRNCISAFWLMIPSKVKKAVLPRALECGRYYAASDALGVRP